MRIYVRTSPRAASPLLQMEKVWNIKEQPDDGQAHELARLLGISPIVASLLIQRGIDTPAAAFDFFNPDLERLHDPFLMRDMDRAVERVWQALEKREKILVYGDYDVDGVTAVSLVY